VKKLIFGSVVFREEIKLFVEQLVTTVIKVPLRRLQDVDPAQNAHEEH
jgi:hypothetical protein